GLGDAGCVRGVHDDGQVRELADEGEDAEVEGVARHRLEGADAALAEDDLPVAGGEDVLGGHEPLLDGGGEAALEHDGLADGAELLEEGEVLHVARAYLQNVGI